MKDGARPGGQVVIAVALALLGFLLATQFRAQRGLTDRLAIERESDLGQILTELTARNDRLLEGIVDLRVRLAQTSGSEDQQRALAADARAQIEALEILLGVTPVTGRGVAVVVSDPKASIGPDVLLDTIQELRDAGAEAIDVNGIRVVASTAFGGREGAVIVGGHAVQAPFSITAIGMPSTLAEAMRIPGGVADTISARDGASVRVEERSSVSIASVHQRPTFVFAKPVPRR